MTENIYREEVRNKLLRRADWRFLLPHPHPEKTVCFAGGLLAESARVISEQVVGGNETPDGDCDLALATDPTRDTLGRAWDALRPGGSCYIEWYSALAGGVAGVRRRLAAAGFQDVRCYWTWPNPRTGLFWVPLDAPHSIRHFLATRPPARSLKGRALKIGREQVWRLIARAGTILPVYAIARKPAGANGSEPGTQPKAQPEADSDFWEMIRTRWPEWGLGPEPKVLGRTLLTTGLRSSNKVVAIVSAEQGSAGTMVVKIPRIQESTDKLEVEAEILRAVHAQAAGKLSGVPRVLYCEKHNGIVTVGETYVPGQPVFMWLRRENYREIALRVTDWLADFTGRPERLPPSQWWDRLVEPTILRFRQSFGPVVDPELIRETKELLGQLGDLPIVCEHRDFSPWNVLMSGTGEVSVIDWESAVLEGFPLWDLLRFLTYLAFFVDGALETGRINESYRATLDPATMTGAVRQECVARYAARLGMDPEALRPLGALVWMFHSREDYARFAADVAGTPSPETLRGSRYVGLWQEELRHNRPVRAG